MKQIYLAATVAGAVIPYVFFVDFFREEGLGLPTFLDAAFANGVAGGFSADLVMSSLVVWIAPLTRAVRASETASPRPPAPWPFIAVNLAIGLSCALPLYLYWQERARDGRRSAAPVSG